MREQYINFDYLPKERFFRFFTTKKTTGHRFFFFNGFFPFSGPFTYIVVGCTLYQRRVVGVATTCKLRDCNVWVGNSQLETLVGNSDSQSFPMDNVNLAHVTFHAEVDHIRFYRTVLEILTRQNKVHLKFVNRPRFAQIKPWSFLWTLNRLFSRLQQISFTHHGRF